MAVTPVLAKTAAITHPMTIADELRFQRWYLSLETEGVLPERDRTALACAATFQRALRGNQAALALVARAAASNPSTTGSSQ